MEEATNILVPIVMFGSNLIFLLLFGLLPARRAVLASFLGAWLFLPIKTYEIEGLPDFSKLFVICLGIMVAVIIFDFKRMLTYRPNWVDIPIVIWCLAPIASSVANGLGWYDGASEALAQTILWGFPYFLGRIYFTNWSHIKELAIAFIGSAFVYAPFIVYEMFFSPQLHRIVYGAHQHKFDQTLRFGMWRPMAFMHHGLMVAFWFMACALIALWMWRSGTIKRFKVPFTSYELPFGLLAGALVALTILCVSVNAWLWLLLGITILFVSDMLKTRWVLLVILLCIPMYIITQGTSVWPGETAVDFATGLFGVDRAQSLEFRYDNEELLTEKARQQWVFGWAGWDRQLVKSQWGPTTVPDSLWVIVFGKFGAFGLVGLVFTLLLPTIIFIYRYPPWLWSHPNLAPAAAISVLLVLYMFDGLLNAMINPLFMVAVGGLMGTFANLPQLRQVTLPEATSIKRSAPATD